MVVHCTTQINNICHEYDWNVTSSNAWLPCIFFGNTCTCTCSTSIVLKFPFIIWCMLPRTLMHGNQSDEASMVVSLLLIVGYSEIRLYQFIEQFYYSTSKRNIGTEIVRLKCIEAQLFRSHLAIFHSPMVMQYLFDEYRYAYSSRSFFL